MAGLKFRGEVGTYIFRKAAWAVSWGVCANERVKVKTYGIYVEEAGVLLLDAAKVEKKSTA